jgi:hypothetical protein
MLGKSVLLIVLVMNGSVIEAVRSRLGPCQRCPSNGNARNTECLLNEEGNRTTCGQFTGRHGNMVCMFCNVVTYPRAGRQTVCETLPGGERFSSLFQAITCGSFEDTRMRIIHYTKNLNQAAVQAPSWNSDWDVACNPPCMNPTDIFSAQDWSEAPSRRVVRFNTDGDSQCYEFDQFVTYVRSKHPNPVNDPLRGGSRIWTLGVLSDIARNTPAGKTLCLV